MPLSTPVVFSLYDDDDQVIETYSRARITTHFLERAIEISEGFKVNTDPKVVLQALDQLLVEFYGDKFTLAQVRDGGDVGEKMAIVMAIIERAGGITREAGNP